MKRTEREAVGVIVEILDREGLAWSLRRGKHLCVVITAPSGAQHSIPVAGTPRADSAAQQNWARQETLRLLERLGLKVTRGARTKPRKTEHHRDNSTFRTVYRFEPREPGRLDRNPFDVLADLLPTDPRSTAA